MASTRWDDAPEQPDGSGLKTTARDRLQGNAEALDGSLVASGALACGRTANAAMVETERQGETHAEDLRALLHRLNNQLGVILAHAELIEAKAGDDMQRARANQVVSAALEAMGIAREIRATITPLP